MNITATPSGSQDKKTQHVSIKFNGVIREPDKYVYYGDDSDTSDYLSDDSDSCSSDYSSGYEDITDSNEVAGVSSKEDNHKSLPNPYVKLIRCDHLLAHTTTHKKDVCAIVKDSDTSLSVRSRRPCSLYHSNDFAVFGLDKLYEYSGGSKKIKREQIKNKLKRKNTNSFTISSPIIIKNRDAAPKNNRKQTHSPMSVASQTLTTYVNGNSSSTESLDSSSVHAKDQDLTKQSSVNRHVSASGKPPIQIKEEKIDNSANKSHIEMSEESLYCRNDASTTLTTCDDVNISSNKPIYSYAIRPKYLEHTKGHDAGMSIPLFKFQEDTIVYTPMESSVNMLGSPVWQVKEGNPIHSREEQTHYDCEAEIPDNMHDDDGSDIDVENDWNARIFVTDQEKVNHDHTYAVLEESNYLKIVRVGSVPHVEESLQMCTRVSNKLNKIRCQSCGSCGDCKRRRRLVLRSKLEMKSHSVLEKERRIDIRSKFLEIKRVLGLDPEATKKLVLSAALSEILELKSNRETLQLLEKQLKLRQTRLALDLEHALENS